MYKLGILLFGEARVYKVAKMYFDQAFPDCEIDYFGHAWNTESAPPIEFYVEHDVNKLQQELRDIYNTSNIQVTNYKKEFKRLSRPLEKYKSKGNRSQSAEMVSGGVRVNQWRSFEKASKLLKKSKKEYDLIICSRFDIVFQPRPNIIEQILDKIKNCRATMQRGGKIPKENGNEILVTGEGFNEQNNTTMQDLVFFGTKEGVVKFGQNFTRNRIKHIRADCEQDKILPTLNDVEKKLIKRYISCRGYREIWGLQLIENKISRRIVGNFGKTIIARPGCPSLDLKTIIAYEGYYNFFKSRLFLIEKMRSFKNWKQYNPEFDYIAAWDEGPKSKVK